MIELLIFMAWGAIGGTAAAKGVSEVRKWINEGSTINICCRKCRDNGPHPFIMIDRSWASGAALGVLGGGFFGLIAGVTARRIFYCRKCRAAMYDDGQRPSGWNADEAIKAFLNYPSLKEAVEEFQGLVECNQKIAMKHTNEINLLFKMLQDVEFDKIELEKRIRTLMKVIHREAA